jgi:hypothetical protein
MPRFIKTTLIPFTARRDIVNFFSKWVKIILSHIEGKILLICKDCLGRKGKG